MHLSSIARPYREPDIAGIDRYIEDRAEHVGLHHLRVYCACEQLSILQCDEAVAKAGHHVDIVKHHDHAKPTPLAQAANKAEDFELMRISSKEVDPIGRIEDLDLAVKGTVPHACRKRRVPKRRLQRASFQRGSPVKS